MPANMTPERWQQVKSVFHRVRELAPEERSSFLDQACSSDHSLRLEVESLLSSDAEARSAILESGPTRATLTAGTRLGEYEIQRLMGSGGMGEVYRARDTRLGREVAIKVLPAFLSRDPDRLRRFEQEARAAAALNDPNILAVFQLGTYEASPYLVSELLEGVTLREQLRRGPIAVRKAIDYGVQIARGLAAAHEKGIVHRDLKPENLFTTNDGRVKILDFGLAKLKPAAHSDHSAPTVVEETEPGMVMGTVGYMSPEQVRGEIADHRTDIFSFGAILYEMLAGERAFHKGTSAETMSAILNEEPTDLLASTPSLSPALTRIVHHCLEKNPAERFESARDIAFALQSWSESSRAVAMPARQISWTKGHLKSVIGIALFSVVAVAAYTVAGSILSSSVRVHPSFRRLTFRPGTVLAARFGPDGRTVIYGAKLDGNPSRVYVTTVDSPGSRPLDAGEVSLLAVSDTGELALVRGCRTEAMLVDCHGTLATMPISGGAPRDVVDGVEAADWVPQSNDLAIAHKVGGACHLEFPVGNLVYETSGWISSLRVSPSGNAIAIAYHDSAAGSDGGQVLILDRQGRQLAHTEEFDSIEGVAWGPSGQQVWFVGHKTGSGWADELHFIDFSGREGLLWRFQGVTRLHDVSRDGVILISKEDWRIHLNFRATNASEEKDLSWFDMSELLDFARDSGEVLFLEAGEAALNTDLYLRRTDGSPATRLAAGDWAALSPDGKMVVSVSSETPAKLLLIPTGVGQPQPINNGDLIKTYGQPAFLPDGKYLIFAGSDGKNWRLYKQDLQGGKPVAFTKEIGQPGPHPFQLVSPDGKLAMTPDLQGRLTIYPLDLSSPRPMRELKDDEVPANWAGDDDEVYIYRDDFPIVVYKLSLSTGKKIPVTRFNPTDAIGLEGVRSLRIASDGHAGAYSYTRAMSQLYVMRDLRSR